MSYTVVGEIIGFENTKNVAINQIDELFFTLKDLDNENISFTLVNPYLLREYDFEIPDAMQNLLGINENSKLSVYNILLIQKPLEKSVINFLAPIILNHDNNTIAQVILDPKQHPDYGMAEPIESFKN